MQNDLISRSKLHKSIQREEPIIIDGLAYVRYGAMLAKISMAPGVDALEVRHAKNVTPTHYSDEFVCGNCGFSCEITELRHDDEDGFGMGEATAHEYECRFCPDCGAKIAGGTNDV